MNSESDKKPGCLPRIWQTLRQSLGLPRQSAENIMTGEITRQMLAKLEKYQNAQTALATVRAMAKQPRFQNSPFALNEIGDFFNRHDLPEEALDLFGQALIMYPDLTPADQLGMQVVRTNYVSVLRAINQQALRQKESLMWPEAVKRFNLVLRSTQTVLNSLEDEDISHEHDAAVYWLNRPPSGFRPRSNKP